MILYSIIIDATQAMYSTIFDERWKGILYEQKKPRKTETATGAQKND